MERSSPKARLADAEGAARERGMLCTTFMVVDLGGPPPWNGARGGWSVARASQRSAMQRRRQSVVQMVLIGLAGGQGSSGWAWTEEAGLSRHDASG